MDSDKKLLYQLVSLVKKMKEDGHSDYAIMNTTRYTLETIEETNNSIRH